MIGVIILKATKIKNVIILTVIIFIVLLLASLVYSHIIRDGIIRDSSISISHYIAEDVFNYWKDRKEEYNNYIKIIFNNILGIAKLIEIEEGKTVNNQQKINNYINEIIKTFPIINDISLYKKSESNQYEKVTENDNTELQEVLNKELIESLYENNYVNFLSEDKAKKYILYKTSNDSIIMINLISDIYYDKYDINIESLRDIEYVLFKNNDKIFRYVLNKKNDIEMLYNKIIVSEESNYRIVEINFNKYIEIDIPYLKGKDFNIFTVGLPMFIIPPSIRKKIRPPFMGLLIVPIILAIFSIGLILLAIKLEKTYIESNMNKERYSSIVLMAEQVAHEIRNPLNSISLIVQTIEEEIETGEVDKNNVEMLNKSINSIDSVVRDFISLNKEFSISKKKIKVKPYFTEILNKYKKLYPDVIIKEKVENISYNFDPKRIEQVINNIVLNSVQSMTDFTGNIIFNVKLNWKKKLEIIISDTGKGIDQKIINKIKEPFFTTKKTGTGMGLVIIDKIIQAHKGKMEIDTISGKGTTIKINI